MTRTRMTPEQAAAFKAANRAKAVQVSSFRPAKPAPRKSQRQQFQEAAQEAADMIRAARRQGLIEALPNLIAHHNRMTALANHAALS